MDRGRAVIAAASATAGLGALTLIERLGFQRTQEARWVLAVLLTLFEDIKGSPAAQTRLRRIAVSIGGSSAAAAYDDVEQDAEGGGVGAGGQLSPITAGVLRGVHVAALSSALASGQLSLVFPVLLLEAAASSHLLSSQQNRSLGISSNTFSILLSSSVSLLTATAALGGGVSQDANDAAMAVTTPPPFRAVVSALVCVVTQIAALALRKRSGVTSNGSASSARRRLGVETVVAVVTVLVLIVCETTLLLGRGFRLLLDLTTGDILSVTVIAILLTFTGLSFLSLSVSSPQTTVTHVAASQLAAWIISLGTSATYLSQALVTLLPTLLGLAGSTTSSEGGAPYKPIVEQGSIAMTASSGWNPRLTAGLVALTFIPSLVQVGLRHIATSSFGFLGPADFDVVISHYNEDLDLVRHTLDQVRSELPGRPRLNFMIYSKGPETPAGQRLHELKREGLVDSIIEVPNWGREGETYLKHIVNHYSTLAPQTLFLQPHIAWDWVALPRLRSIHPRDGFVSLGPYLNATCFPDGNEVDTNGMRFGRLPQIYASFTGDLCPATGFAITYAGQFLVSRQRIHRNPRWRYQSLLEYFDAPTEGSPKSWIWGPGEGWWDSTPSNPTFGHALERSWPSIFSCSRPELAWDCGEDAGPHCGCRD